uniref:Uncharacterized protein LOC106760180 n=1 Tax=Rhizophora mucronata TaxID=61149 RepID=A0A2P2MW49_RHIMU
MKAAKKTVSKHGLHNLRKRINRLKKTRNPIIICRRSNHTYPHKYFHSVLHPFFLFLKVSESRHLIIHSIMHLTQLVVSKLDPMGTLLRVCS